MVASFTIPKLDPIGYLVHMIFTPEMTRKDAILVATSDSSGTQSRILSYEEERAIVDADRDNRFWRSVMNNRVGVCG